MRWLIYFLLVLNVLVFTWFKFQQDYNQNLSEQKRSSHSFNFEKAQPITLISEKPVMQEVSDKTMDSLEQVEATESVIQQEPACWLIGHFPEVISARDMRITLEDVGVYSHIVAKDRELPPVSWVYIPPFESREAALAQLRELQSKDIDSFIITEEGDDQFAISLGFFGNRDSAVMVMKDRQAQGYQAEITERVRKRSAFWLGVYEVQHSNKELMGKRLENELKKNGRLKRHEISCKKLALLETKQ